MHQSVPRASPTSWSPQMMFATNLVPGNVNIDTVLFERVKRVEYLLQWKPWIVALLNKGQTMNKGQSITTQASFFKLNKTSQEWLHPNSCHKSLAKGVALIVGFYCIIKKQFIQRFSQVSLTPLRSSRSYKKGSHHLVITKFIQNNFFVFFPKPTLKFS